MAIETASPSDNRKVSLDLVVDADCARAAEQTAIVARAHARVARHENEQIRSIEKYTSATGHLLPRRGCHVPCGTG